MNNQVTRLYKVCSCCYCFSVSATFLQIKQRRTNLHFQRLSIKTWHIANYSRDQGETEEKENFPEDLYRNEVAVTIVISIAVVPTVFLNALVIFAVSIKRPLQTNNNILLACMAGTDLLTGLIVQPMAVALEVLKILGASAFCTLEKIYSVILAGISFASTDHLVLISVERYIAIKYSLRYTDIVTRKWLKNRILLAWAFAGLVTILETTLGLTLVDTKTEIFLTSLLVVNAVYTTIGTSYIAVISYTSAYIFFQTRRHKKRIQHEQVTYEEAKRARKDSRSAKTLAFILLVLILTNVPSLILMLSSFSDSASIEPNVRRILWKWAVTFSLCKSFLNPIIYCWRVKKMQRAFFEILHLRPENTPAGIE